MPRRRWAIRTVCHNGQSAALLSSSGLVMYFSTLPAPSSSAPCILTILTHLRVCVKICILTHPQRYCCPVNTRHVLCCKLFPSDSPLAAMKKYESLPSTSAARPFVMSGRKTGHKPCASLTTVAKKWGQTLSAQIVCLSLPQYLTHSLCTPSRCLDAERAAGQSPCGLTYKKPKPRTRRHRRHNLPM